MGRQIQIRDPRHESSTATRCSSRDPCPRLRGHGRLPAWGCAVGRAEGDLAPSNAGLGLDIPDGVGRRQFVLDPPDPADRSMEPDSSAVDLHAGHAPTRGMDGAPPPCRRSPPHQDRKSTRLNSSHGYISYAVFCLKKKKKKNEQYLKEKKKKNKTQ